MSTRRFLARLGSRNRGLSEELFKPPTPIRVDVATIQEERETAWGWEWIPEREMERCVELLDACYGVVKSRDLAKPYLLYPFRPYSTTTNSARAFIVSYFSPESTTSLHELQLLETDDVTTILRWTWSRIPGGIISHPTYDLFAAGEREAEFHEEAFHMLIPLVVSSELRTRMVFGWLEFLSGVAAHFQKNGMVLKKLARWASFFAFEPSEEGMRCTTAGSEAETPRREYLTDGFIAPTNGRHKGRFRVWYAEWERAAEAMEHLFFAYLRSVSASGGAPTMSTLPLSLRKVLQETPYPLRPRGWRGSLSDWGSQTTLYAVMASDRAAATPLGMLRRAGRLSSTSATHAEEVLNAIHYDGMTLLEEESKRILEAIDAAYVGMGQVYSPTTLGDRTWARFMEDGFEGLDGDDDTESISSFSRLRTARREEEQASEAKRSMTMTSISSITDWTSFRSDGFAGGVEDGLGLLPPDKALPPVVQRDLHSRAERRAKEEMMWKGVLVANERIGAEIDGDGFWTVWFTAQSPEIGDKRKGTWGSLACVEMERGAWVVVEEVVPRVVENVVTPVGQGKVKDKRPSLAKMLSMETYRKNKTGAGSRSSSEPLLNNSSAPSSRQGTMSSAYSNSNPPRLAPDLMRLVIQSRSNLNTAMSIRTPEGRLRHSPSQMTNGSKEVDGGLWGDAEVRDVLSWTAMVDIEEDESQPPADVYMPRAGLKTRVSMIDLATGPRGETPHGIDEKAAMKEMAMPPPTAEFEGIPSRTTMIIEEKTIEAPEKLRRKKSLTGLKNLMFRRKGRKLRLNMGCATPNSDDDDGGDVPQAVPSPIRRAVSGATICTLRTGTGKSGLSCETAELVSPVLPISPQNIGTTETKSPVSPINPVLEALRREGQGPVIPRKPVNVPMTTDKALPALSLVTDMEITPGSGGATPGNLTPTSPMTPKPVNSINIPLVRNTKKPLPPSPQGEYFSPIASPTPTQLTATAEKMMGLHVAAEPITGYGPATRHIDVLERPRSPEHGVHHQWPLTPEAEKFAQLKHDESMSSFGASQGQTSVFEVESEGERSLTPASSIEVVEDGDGEYHDGDQEEHHQVEQGQQQILLTSKPLSPVDELEEDEEEPVITNAIMGPSRWSQTYGRGYTNRFSYQSNTSEPVSSSEDEKHGQQQKALSLSSPASPISATGASRWAMIRRQSMDITARNDREQDRETERDRLLSSPEQGVEDVQDDSVEARIARIRARVAAMNAGL
ncbi:hypothetical protein SAICODRAFT_23623 [Saitoella complicata NRRL Y-17804]|uniref:uncharacterized protein n=1 Tax=Saitoella complicata (strain BCRC 22490 / CBS 7301 / JCM 7358 / NBRC 10748 / NRRL Y-17804) TaxID=698492 RepID=UPI0008678F91|nr:uncharacterized protein SAICODRAFT_23623 [Saitoella complicata NRRL Y-17804]ODQ54915.1 hypothetical protein SAICODRAFT_23623 [Saitoella complicata NRRL Y-17804]